MAVAVIGQIALGVGQEVLKKLCSVGIDRLIGPSDQEKNVEIKLDKGLDELSRLRKAVDAVNLGLDVLGYSLMFGREIEHLQFLAGKFVKLNHDDEKAVEELVTQIFVETKMEETMTKLHNMVIQQPFLSNQTLLEAFRQKNSGCSEYWYVQCLADQLLSLQLITYVMWEEMKRICSQMEERRSTHSPNRFFRLLRKRKRKSDPYLDSVDVPKMATEKLREQIDTIQRVLLRCSLAIVNVSKDTPYIAVPNRCYIDGHKMSTPKPLKGVRFSQPWMSTQKDSRITIEIKYWDVKVQDEPSVGPMPFANEQTFEVAYDKRDAIDIYNDEPEPSTYLNDYPKVHTYMNRVPYPEIQVVTGVQIQRLNGYLALSIEYKMRGGSERAYQLPRHWKNNDPTYPGEVTLWDNWNHDSVDSSWIEMKHPGWCTGVGIYKNNCNRLAFRMEVRYS